MGLFDDRDSPPTRKLDANPTRKLKGDAAPAESDAPAPAAGSTELIAGKDAGDWTKGGGTAILTAPLSSDGPQTTYVKRPNALRADSGKAPSIEEAVLGWLVVVRGPGLGKSFVLTMGLQRIGRATSQQVSLDFGSQSDSTISREEHAVLQYDRRARAFFLAQKNNNVYLNGERVGLNQERQLNNLDEIEIGESTRLRFVAFCGPEFDWSEAVDA
ncbi:MAG: FHA domain-containing protein [Gammaproteobacteria bacterium]